MWKFIGAVRCVMSCLHVSMTLCLCSSITSQVDWENEALYVFLLVNSFV